MKEYATKILDSFSKQIIEYFESFRSDRNALYLNYLEDVQMQPPQTRTFDIGIPMETKKKIDYEMEAVEYSMPTLARLTFKNFPLKEVMIRVEFPQILYGPKGLYPKVIISAELNKPWPGEFGLVWLPLTGSEDFAFHPYQDKENKAAEMQNFYAEGIVDPLCDFLNTSAHKLTEKLKENIQLFIATDTVEVWNYKHPFKKKNEYVMLEIPIYCEFFDDNDASILYFEFYALKNKWIPPADIIVNIMQYIGLATELFDDDGNLVPEAESKHIDKFLEVSEKVAVVVKEVKKKAELREEWDPFKPIEAKKRDTLGYSMDDGIVIKEDHKSVLDQVSRMKALMQQGQESQVDKPVPIAQPTPTPPPEPQPRLTTPTAAPPTAPPSADQPRLRGGGAGAPKPSLSSLLDGPALPASVTPTLRPAIPIPAPQPTTIAPAPTPAPQAQPSWPSYPEELKVTPATPAPTTQPSWPTYPNELKSAPVIPTPAPQPVIPTPTPAPAPTSGFQWDDQPAKPATPTPILPSVATKEPAPAAKPAIPTFTSPKDWFANFQMNQCVMVGSGQDLPFRKRGDFKILAALPKPFMLMFARDQLRVKKAITSGETIEILYELYKSGHISPL